MRFYSRLSVSDWCHACDNFEMESALYWDFLDLSLCAVRLKTLSEDHHESH